MGNILNARQFIISSLGKDKDSTYTKKKLSSALESSHSSYIRDLPPNDHVEAPIYISHCFHRLVWFCHVCKMVLCFPQHHKPSVQKHLGFYLLAVRSLVLLSSLGYTTRDYFSPCRKHSLTMARTNTFC